MQAPPQNGPGRNGLQDPKIDPGSGSLLKWRPVRVESFMPPPPPSTCNAQTVVEDGPEMELDLDKDSDFQQHAQFQPDHASSFPFHCYCGHEFHQQKSYRMHILDGLCIHWRDIKIRGNVIVCTCGVEFAQRGSLFRHLKARQCKAYWPDGGRALHCLCGAKFNRRDNMIRHQRSPRCQQNCARLGVKGNPRDVIPPLRKPKFHKPGQSSEQLLLESSGDYFEKTLDEAEVNYRWYKQFGNHKRSRTSLAPPPLEMRPSCIDKPSELFHKPPSSGRLTPTPQSFGNLVEPQEPSSQDSQITSPTGYKTPLSQPSSRQTSVESIEDGQLESRRRFTRRSTFYGFERAQSMGNTQKCLVHSQSSQDSETQSDYKANSEAIEVKQQEPEESTGVPSHVIGIQQEPEESIGAPSHVIGVQQLPFQSSNAPRVTGVPIPVVPRPVVPSESPEAPGDQKDPQSSQAPTTKIPPAVSPINPQTAEQPLETPLGIAMHKLSRRIDKILSKYDISDSTFAPAIADTLKTIIAGFLDKSKVPRDRAALLCETISVGVSQILLVKLADVSNSAFVQIAYRVDNAVYEELCEPLKSLTVAE